MLVHRLLVVLMTSTLLTAGCPSEVQTGIETSVGTDASDAADANANDVAPDASDDAPDTTTSDTTSDDGTTATDEAPDAPAPDAVADASDGDTGTPVAKVWGRFESGGPVVTCGQVKNDWESSDGPLLRMAMNVCGDDGAALAQTIVANLDAVEARGGRALLVLNQGVNLPAGWLATCETFTMPSGDFAGDICVPWDPAYQSALSELLNNHIGPAVAGHSALAAVYFTISTMTNGAEMHFRVSKAAFTPHPGDLAFGAAYRDVMDLFQAAFDVPILFEAGHCIFDVPGAQAGDIDCQTPLALYQHARDTYGASKVGLALWNCAERFWYGPGSQEDHVRPLLEEAAADGVSMGCQTVGNFTDQPCRFSHAEVADYGEQQGFGMNTTCLPSPMGNDSERACVDTLNWFAGVSSQAPGALQLQGTWVESWSGDTAPGGTSQTSSACGQAVDLFIQP